MERRYWVYIVADKPNGTIYTGFTSDIARRSYEHRHKLYDGFSKKYKTERLVWCGEFPTAMEAIAFEKKIKKWRREWKVGLIEKENPDWNDLFDVLNG